MKARASIVALLAMLSVAACKRERPPERALGDTSAPLPPPQAQLNDSNVVGLLRSTNDAEVSFARAAQPRAAAASVKAFAARIIEEHTAMQAEIDSLMASRRLAPQDPVGGRVEDMTLAARADSIVRLTGAALDSAYVNQQIAAHRQALEDLRLFEFAARDEGLRALLSRSVPRVQAHLQRAMEISRELSR